MAHRTDRLRRLLMAPLVASALAACTPLLVGCGPIISVSLIVDAEAKLAAAEAAEAERYAPYEHTAAKEYLQKAHEELGFADYGPAIDYAYKASDAAEKGTKKASDERAKQLDQPPVVEEVTEPAPAAAPAGPTIKRTSGAPR